MVTDARRLLLLLALIAACACASVASAELLDRLVVVVGGRPILQSDVHLAGVLRLVAVPVGREGSDAEVVERLIDRALMLDEVDRFGPAEPEVGEVEARLAEVRASIGAESLARTLEATGVPEPALRGWLRDNLRIERYLAQRFNALAQPTSDDVAEYYEAHPDEFTVAGTRRALADVEAEIQQSLMRSRRAELIDEWQQSLRRRARIRRIPMSDAP